MTRALADRISARRASDRLAALNPFIQPDAGASVAPVETSSTDEPLIPEGSAGAATCLSASAEAVPGLAGAPVQERPAENSSSRGGVEGHASNGLDASAAEPLRMSAVGRSTEPAGSAGIKPGPREAFDLGDIPSFLDRRHKQ